MPNLEWLTRLGSIYSVVSVSAVVVVALISRCKEIYMYCQQIGLLRNLESTTIVFEVKKSRHNLISIEKKIQKSKIIKFEILLLWVYTTLASTWF